jgi:hypothetical protein
MAIKAVNYVDKLADQALAGISAEDWLLAGEITSLFPTKPASRDDLIKALELRPDLQAQLASKTGYTPSKWLLENELIEIAKRRSNLGIHPLASLGDAYARAAGSGLMGISFSGGGIRSATFNLGVLQGLAELNLLKCFDYFSSVSGGGYIHQWFAAWTRRRGFASVAQDLIPLPEEGSPPSHPEPIRWLRRYSNYLTPEKGLFTADSWVVVATWLRNTLLNQIILISGLLFLVLLPLTLPRIFAFFSTVPQDGPVAAVTIGAIFYLFLMATFFLGRNLWRFDRHPVGDHGLFGQSGVQLGLIFPFLAASLLFTFLFPIVSATRFGVNLWLCFSASALLLFALSVTIIVAGEVPLCYLKSHHRTAQFKTLGDFWRQTPKCFAHVRMVFVLLGLLTASLFASVCGAAWIASTQWWIAWLCSHHSHYGHRLALLTGPPVALSGLLITVILLLGLVGRIFDDARREWLARLGAWMGLYMLAWVIAVGFSLFGYFAVGWFVCHFKTMLGTLITWAGATLSGLLAGKSSMTGGTRDDKAPSKWNPIEILAVVAPYIFIAGLLVMLSALAESTLRHLLGQPWWILLIAFLAPLVGCLLFAWRVDINEFSMHAFYRNRLARCYLGASNPARDPNPFSGFDDRDQHFAVLKPKPERDAQLAVSELLSDKGYDGPFPIFCTALNLTFGEDLAWQERKAASFAFTPLYSGYDVAWTAARSEARQIRKGAKPKMRFNGFALTGTYAYPEPGIHVSTAAAISGAAMSPNGGFHTSPATAFLMTLFNVRLGWWLRNPRMVDQEGKRMDSAGDGISPAPESRLFGGRYPSASPHFSLLYLVGELLGHADDTSPFVYLTDGGHFDNMGLYELVRRRCRFIVICDSEADPNLEFEGIGMAIRKCRIDFGAEVSLDLRSIQHAPDTEYSGAHCVVGTIVYPEDKAGGKSGGKSKHQEGIVVYIKSSITGDEPGDILNYKKENSAFPHDTTLNQWFTESQFESYRRLGHHVAISTFQPAGPSQLNCVDLDNRGKYFDNLRKIWAPFTPQMQHYWAQHTKLYDALLENVRKDPNLARLFDMLFVPGDGKWKTSVAAHDEYAVAFSSELIEFMWIIFAQLSLVQAESREHPFAEGWVGIFRDWAKIDVVQDAWRKYGPTYSLSFRIFAVCNVKLPAITGIMCEPSKEHSPHGHS